MFMFGFSHQGLRSAPEKNFDALNRCGNDAVSVALAFPATVSHEFSRLLSPLFPGRLKQEDNNHFPVTGLGKLSGF